MTSYYDDIINMKPDGFLFISPNKQDMDSIYNEGKIPPHLNRPGSLHILGSFVPSPENPKRFMMKIITRKITPKGQVDRFYIMIRMYCVTFREDKSQKLNSVYLKHVVKTNPQHDLTKVYDLLPLELIDECRKANPHFIKVCPLYPDSRMCACCTSWSHLDDDSHDIYFDSSEDEDNEDNEDENEEDEEDEGKEGLESNEIILPKLLDEDDEEEIILNPTRERIQFDLDLLLNSDLEMMD